MHSSHRGFTVLELLVVVAIIGVLAAVVLTSLSGSQEGAQNATVQQSLGSVRSAAQLYYTENNFSFADMCNGGGNQSEIRSTLEDLDENLDFITGVNGGNNTDIVCNSTPTNYAIIAPLLEDGDAGGDGNPHWCVDSSGFQGEKNASLDSNEYDCSAAQPI